MRTRSRQWFAASDPNNAPAATPESPQAKIFATQNFSLQVIFGGMWRDEIPAAIERSIFPWHPPPEGRATTLGAIADGSEVAAPSSTLRACARLLRARG
jgi:hypothetical protein